MVVQLKNSNEYIKYYRFKPNHDLRRIFGQFELHNLSDRYEIWCLGIIGDERGKGYGTQMLTEFLKQFNHDKPLYLYVYKDNEIAIKLYKKAGFIIVGDFGKDAYTMQYKGE